MSKINENKSNEKQSKSSQIIIISKNRYSGSNKNLNYMTLQEGELKLTLEMKNQKLTRQNINQAISSLKKNTLKQSRSYGKLDNYNKKLDLILNKKEKELNDKIIIKKIKINSNINVETTKSINLKSSFNYIEQSKNNNEDEIHIKHIDIISKDNNSNEIISNDNTSNDNNSISINNKDKNSLNNNINSNSNRKIITQNFFNNITDRNKNLKIQISKPKSEEIKLVNPRYTNDEKKNEINKEKNKQSEKTSKSVFGSILEHKGQEVINNLISENGLEDKSEKESIKSKDELISKDKNINIDENDAEEDDEEYEEVEDEYEYDEKIKDDNNRKIINNINIINNNNLNIINNNNIYINNNENKKENYEKIKNEFNEEIKNANDEKIIKCISLQQNNNNNNNNIYKMCYLCEHTYNLIKFFVAECKDHYICKRCAKGYYEELIEDDIKDILCPFLKCRAPVNINNLKNIISQEHFKRLTNKNQNTTNYIDESQNKYFFTKLKTNYSKENVELYTKRHVIDINSNKNFFNYNREKEGYCPFCFEGAVFSKTNTHFYKCLNCLSKICRYCFKEFNEKHMDIKDNQHCKVFYRLEEDVNNKNSKIGKILMQYFFVFACFYLSFAGSFYYFRMINFRLVNMNNNRNIIKYFILYFFIIIFFIISFPFIFLLLPYFPSILALSDY